MNGYIKPRFLVPVAIWKNKFFLPYVKWFFRIWNEPCIPVLWYLLPEISICVVPFCYYVLPKVLDPKIVPWDHYVRVSLTSAQSLAGKKLLHWVCIVKLHTCFVSHGSPQIPHFPPLVRHCLEYPPQYNSWSL